MRKITLSLAVLGALAFAFAGNASATLYNIEHSHSQGLSGPTSFTGGTPSGSTFVGRFAMEPRPNTSYPAILPAQYPMYTVSTVHLPPTEALGFFSYCLEPDQGIGVGHGLGFQYPFTIGALAGSDGISGTPLANLGGASEASLIKELFGRYNPLLSADPTGPYTGGTFRTASAALQLAIWEINLDAATTAGGFGTWSLATGLMRAGSFAFETGATARADAVALSMLNSLTGTGPMAYGLEGLRHATIQDLIIQSTIPEPLTMLGMFLGLGSVGAYIRKRRMA